MVDHLLENSKAIPGRSCQGSLIKINHFTFAWDFALDLTLAGTGVFFCCARYPWSRASMEGRSLVPLVVPLSLGIEARLFSGLADALV